MRRRAGLISWLLGADVIPRPGEVQPHLVSEPGVLLNVGPYARAVYAPIQTTAMIFDPPVGYNTPDVVRIYGDLPPNVIVDGGAPVILDNNAPQGGC